MLCRPQDDGQAITSDSGAREDAEYTHQVSVTDGDFRFSFTFGLAW